MELNSYLRFPIPDLRPSSQVDKLPWWQKNLRDEIIILTMTDVMIQMVYLSSQPPQQVELTCKDVLGEMPVLVY